MCCYRQHENLKKRHYEQRVRQVELASFTFSLDASRQMEPAVQFNPGIVKMHSAF